MISHVLMECEPPKAGAGKPHWPGADAGERRRRYPHCRRAKEKAMTMRSFLVGCGTISLCLGLAWALGGAVAAPAQTAPPDVGLVTQLCGTATYSNQDQPKEPAPVQAFMKIRRGDHIKLGEPASLQLLYFASGRQETWQGPATLLIGDLESTAQGHRQPLPQPAVQLLPTKVTRRIAGAPLPLPRSSLFFSGATQTRGVKPPGTGTIAPAPPLSAADQTKLKDAEKTYRDLRAKAAADDLTPELFFLAVLAEYQQYPRMDQLIDAMQKKRPGDAVLKDLKVWVRSRSGEPR
jgi:hypothetical protein